MGNLVLRPFSWRMLGVGLQTPQLSLRHQDIIDTPVSYISCSGRPGVWTPWGVLGFVLGLGAMVGSRLRVSPVSVSLDAGGCQGCTRVVLGWMLFSTSWLLLAGTQAGTRPWSFVPSLLLCPDLSVPDFDFVLILSSQTLMFLSWMVRLSCSRSSRDVVLLVGVGVRSGCCPMIP